MSDFFKNDISPPCSPTLQMLQELEIESRGFNEDFIIVSESEDNEEHEEDGIFFRTRQKALKQIERALDESTHIGLRANFTEAQKSHTNNVKHQRTSTSHLRAITIGSGSY